MKQESCLADRKVPPCTDRTRDGRRGDDLDDVHADDHGDAAYAQSS